MKATTKHDIMEKVSYGIECLATEELFSLITDLEPDTFRQVRDSLLRAPAGNMIAETFEAASYGEGEGMTSLKALKCKAVLEIARRMNDTDKHIEQIHGPEDVARYLMPKLKAENKEHFVIVLLNTKNHIIGYKIISIGSLTASIVHPREVFEAATKNHAASMILAHNHPSGDPSPSREDIKVTERLVKAGEIMDIPVLDHIIIGNNTFASLKEKGLMAA